MTVTCFIGLGANIGDPAASVRAAFAALDAMPTTRVTAVSGLYRTPAWGVTEQADFINAVARLETALAPGELLEQLLSIERSAGRDRTAATRWGPRTLDLDLLLYGELIVDEPGLRVPHPHLHERAFALVPLLEIAPDAVIPGVGPAFEARGRMADGDVQALTYVAPPDPVRPRQPGE